MNDSSVGNDAAIVIVISHLTPLVAKNYHFAGLYCDVRKLTSKN